MKKNQNAPRLYPKAITTVSNGSSRSRGVLVPSASSVGALNGHVRSKRLMADGRAVTSVHSSLQLRPQLNIRAVIDLPLTHQVIETFLDRHATDFSAPL